MLDSLSAIASNDCNLTQTVDFTKHDILILHNIVGENEKSDITITRDEMRKEIVVNTGTELCSNKKKINQAGIIFSAMVAIQKTSVDWVVKEIKK